MLRDKVQRKEIEEVMTMLTPRKKCLKIRSKKSIYFIDARCFAFQYASLLFNTNSKKQISIVLSCELFMSTHTHAKTFSISFWCVQNIFCWEIFHDVPFDDSSQNFQLKCQKLRLIFLYFNSLLRPRLNASFTFYEELFDT